jgi:putative heme iron utilization protein
MVFFHYTTHETDEVPVACLQLFLLRQEILKQIPAPTVVIGKRRRDSEVEESHSDWDQVTVVIDTYEMPAQKRAWCGTPERRAIRNQDPP